MGPIYKDSVAAWPLLPLVWCLLYVQIQGVTDFCCSQDKEVLRISGETTGLITTRYCGQAYYGKKMTCNWILDVGPDPYTKIQIFVKSLDLQWAPEGAICNGYDAIEVRDGGFADSRLLASWCGAWNPYTLISTTNTVYISFRSNDREIKKREGVALNFTTFSVAPPSGGCPSGWIENPGSRGHCYILKTHKETWTSAQQFCSNDQANLVSLADNQEAEFIKNYVKDTVEEKMAKVWIGLNDIKDNGEYQWIDEITSTFNIAKNWWLLPHVPDVFLDCVALRAEDGFMQEEFCTEGEVQTLSKYPFICKRNKVGITEIYQVPEANTEKEGDKGNLPPKGIIIAGTVIGFIVLIVIIVVGFIVVKRYKVRGLHSPEGPTAASASHEPARTPSAPPTYNEAMKAGHR